MSDGALTVSNGRVTSRSKAAAPASQQAIRAAARPKRAVADRLMLPGTGSTPSSVLVTPVRDEELAGLHPGNLAMLLIGEQEPRRMEKAAVGRAFGLTPAEARLLAALIDGERLPCTACRHIRHHGENPPQRIVR